MRLNQKGFVEWIILAGVLVAFGIFWVCDDFFHDNDHDSGHGRPVIAAPANPNPIPSPIPVPQPPQSVPEPATLYHLLIGLGILAGYLGVMVFVGRFCGATSEPKRRPGVFNSHHKYLWPDVRKRG